MDRRKIFICIPSKTGGPRIETTAMLMSESSLMTRLNWQWMFHARVGDSYIHRTRNLLVGQFMKTDCTEMLFCDDDVGCRMGDAIRLLSHDADIVGGTYPVKDDNVIRWPVRWIDNKIGKPDSKTGLIEVMALPGGFLRVKRHVIETMIEHRRKTRITLQGLSAKLGVTIEALRDAGLKDEVVDFKDTHAEIAAWNLFDIILGAGGYHGEDYTFCDHARAAGFRVWLDPSLEIVHVGEKAFHAPIGQFLKEIDGPSLIDKMRAELEAA